jgi:TATA-box binding protein (TBP) (component of TFIID and TFIIIB)
MQSFQFESSPLYIIICLALGLGYAAILYRNKHSWSNPINWLLFSLRTITVTFIAFLLLGPIVKFTNNIVEKPSYVFLLDNSASVKEKIDSVHLKKLIESIAAAKRELETDDNVVSIRNLSNKEADFSNEVSVTSDLTSAIRSITDEYEGKNLAEIILISDGIYNAGISPLFTPFRLPINTVGIGDTTQSMDVILKNIAYNKIAYQGNKFPLRAEILLQGITNKELTISVFQSGKKIATESKSTNGKNLLEVDFQLMATERGLQRIDIVVEPTEGESNLKNNRASAFIEVVEGKKKIMVIAPAPHPDIKALRAVVEKNSNYEFILYIPGLTKVDDKLLQPNQADLVIFHQTPDIQNQTKAIFTKLAKNTSGVLYILGKQTNLTQLQANDIPFKFENISQRDEVTPSLNNLFRDFTFSETIGSTISRYPPVSIPFGKFTYPTNASILLYQRIGSVVTERPLALTYDDDGRKVGVIVGEGIWQWRLNEYAETEATTSFDEVFSKLIQYLSTREDKRRFRSFPIVNEFDEVDPIIFESQVYNELFEPVYGNNVQLEVIDEKGAATSYHYIISKDGSRYKIGGLKEGVYKYKASSLLNGNKEEVRGEFLVSAQTIESQNLTADFNLLKKLATNTGGEFYNSTELTKVVADIKANKAKSIIHSEYTFNPLINLKWFFFLLLTLIGTEWFLRKYLGAY